MFFMTILSNAFPTWMATLAATVIYVWFGLADRPMKCKENAPKNNSKDKLVAVQLALAVMAVFFVENFCIWVVSATYYPSHGRTDPVALQDNGRTALWYLANALDLSRNELQRVRNGLNVEWALVGGLIATIMSCELNLNERNAAALCARIIFTLGGARLLRTISFLLTVLPSQLPNCYGRRFPLPPSDWGEWISIGLRPAVDGGCNDLIISGHSTVTTLLACACISVAGNGWFTVAVWTLLAFDYVVEAMQGFHYSIDMWLGAVLTCLIWRVAEPVERAVARKGTIQARIPFSEATSWDLVAYAIPGVVSYIPVTFYPKTVMFYFVVVIALVVYLLVVNRGTLTPYTQHVVLSVVYMAIGTLL